MKTITTLLPADLETPVGIYLKIRDIYPQSALLESSDYHTTHNSVSIIGIDPIAHYMVLDEEIEQTWPEGLTTLTTATTELISCSLGYYVGVF